MIMGSPRRIDLADPMIGTVIANGFSIDGADQLEPDFSAVNLLEDMLHGVHEDRDEDFDDLVDSYIDNVNALALLAFTATEAHLDLDRVADPLARTLGQFAIARQTGSMIAQHQTSRHLRYLHGWFIDYYRQPERLATFPSPEVYGEKAAREYDFRFRVDEHTARIPDVPTTQTATEVMNWQLGITLTRFLGDCDQMITDARNL